MIVKLKRLIFTDVVVSLIETTFLTKVSQRSLSKRNQTFKRFPFDSDTFNFFISVTVGWDTKIN